MTTARFCFCWSLYLGWRTENSFRFLYTIPSPTISFFFHLVATHWFFSFTAISCCRLTAAECSSSIYILLQKAYNTDIISNITRPVYVLYNIGFIQHEEKICQSMNQILNNEKQNWEKKVNKKGNLKELYVAYVIRRRASWLDSFVHGAMITLEMKFYRIPTGKCRVCLYYYRTERYIPERSMLHNKPLLCIHDCDRLVLLVSTLELCQYTITSSLYVCATVHSIMAIDSSHSAGPHAHIHTATNERNLFIDSQAWLSIPV